MNVKNIGIIALVGGGLAVILSTFIPDLKKYHSETKPTRYAVAVMAPNDNGVTGVVHFEDTGNGVLIKYNIRGLADGEHGFQEEARAREDSRGPHARLVGDRAAVDELW